MNSTQLQCFMAAVEQMNFTRAAELLYITQPALSRNISALEEELELLLFVRHNNVLDITPGGKIMYEWLRQSEKNFEFVLESARRANAGTEQALHIGFVKSELPSPRVAAALKRLAELQPDTEVLFDHFHSREIISKLEEHRVDVAVMVSSAVQGNPRLVTRHLGKLKRCIAVPIRHSLAEREKISLNECCGEIFVSVTPEVSPTLSAMIRRLCRVAGFEPAVLEAQTTEEQLQWIVSGKGIGLLVENHIKRGNPLYSFLELEEEYSVDLVCVCDRLNSNPHIQSFLDAFEQTE